MRDRRKPLNPYDTGGSACVGVYDGFPDVIHGYGRYRTRVSARELKKLVLAMMFDLNTHRLGYPMSVVNRSGLFEGEILFEVGIAEGNWFNYLDADELKKFENSAMDSSLPVDFLLILRYRYQREGKSVPLRSDRYLVRYLFEGEGFDILLSHDRGIRRFQMDELLNLLDSMIRAKATGQRHRVRRLEMRAL